MPLPLLLVVLLLLAAPTPSTLDLPALSGASITTVEAVLGPPEDVLDEDRANRSERTFLLGSPSDVLTVSFCDGAAVSFHLVLAQPTRRPRALLAGAGLRPERLAVEEEGEGYRVWGPKSRSAADRLSPVEGFQIERVEATYSEPARAGQNGGRRPAAGWSTLTVDYSSPC